MARARIAVHVTPRSGRDELCGWSGDELSVRVTVPPDAGRANAAVSVLIARAAGVPKTAVRVLRGETSRHKVLEVEGIDQAALDSLLGASGSV
ncbi:MAG: DUF167 domain-containing protein [Coriobacteriia bacterium]|nr:DUF167 domain-containing protein [Coriobacteriia bacterium]